MLRRLHQLVKPLRSPVKPRFEELEDRATPAVVYGTNYHDYITIKPIFTYYYNIHVDAYQNSNYTNKVSSKDNIVPASELHTLLTSNGNDTIYIADHNQARSLQIDGQGGTDEIIFQSNDSSAWIYGAASSTGTMIQTDNAVYETNTNTEKVTLRGDANASNVGVYATRATPVVTLTDVGFVYAGYDPAAYKSGIKIRNTAAGLNRTDLYVNYSQSNQHLYFDVNATSIEQSAPLPKDITPGVNHTLFDFGTGNIRNVDLFAGQYYTSTFIYATGAGTAWRFHGTTAGHESYIFYGSDTLGLQGEVDVYAQDNTADSVRIYDDRITHSMTYDVYVDPNEPGTQYIARQDSGMMRWHGFTGEYSFCNFFTPPVGGSTVNIRGISAGSNWYVGTNVSDAVTAGSQAPLLGGTLDDIQGRLYLMSDGSNVILDNSGSTSAHNAEYLYQYYSYPSFDALTGFGPQAIGLKLDAAASLSLLGGENDDVLGLSSLHASPSIYFNGGGGSNSLNYSSVDEDVYVNLGLGAASGLRGGIANIQNVKGGSANDIIVGTGGNYLEGGPGRDLIIAGAYASVLLGGEGDDILIGGTTDYDNDESALRAISEEWKRDDIDYVTRVNNLLTGNGVPLLDASTVHLNGGGNQITGSEGTDFFFAELVSELVDLDSEAETWVPLWS